MNKPDNRNPIDRPIKDITLSLHSVIEKIRRGGQGQLARDLEKLCIYATMWESHREQMEKARIDKEQKHE